MYIYYTIYLISSRNIIVNNYFIEYALNVFASTPAKELQISIINIYFFNKF